MPKYFLPSLLGPILGFRNGGKQQGDIGLGPKRVPRGAPWTPIRPKSHSGILHHPVSRPLAGPTCILSEILIGPTAALGEVRGSPHVGSAKRPTKAPGEAQEGSQGGANT